MSYFQIRSWTKLTNEKSRETLLPSVAWSSNSSTESSNTSTKYPSGTNEFLYLSRSHMESLESELYSISTACDHYPVVSWLQHFRLLCPGSSSSFQSWISSHSCNLRVFHSDSSAEVSCGSRDSHGPFSLPSLNISSHATMITLSLSLPDNFPSKVFNSYLSMTLLPQVSHSIKYL